MLYVLDLCKHLLSVNAIVTKNGGEVIFSENKVVISKKGENIIEGYKAGNGLFETDFCKSDYAVVSKNV